MPTKPQPDFRPRADLIDLIEAPPHAVAFMLNFMPVVVCPNEYCVGGLLYDEDATVSEQAFEIMPGLMMGMIEMVPSGPCPTCQGQGFFWGVSGN